MVRVTVDKVKTYEFKMPISVGKILRELGFLPFEVLVIKDDKLLTRDVVIKQDCQIEIRTVYSKG